MDLTVVKIKKKNERKRNKEKYEELKQNNDACELIRVIRFRGIKKEIIKFVSHQFFRNIFFMMGLELS